MAITKKEPAGTGGQMIIENVGSVKLDVLNTDITLMALSLTGDNMNSQEIYRGVTSLKDAFGKTKPQKNLNFQDKEGGNVEETFAPTSIEHFAKGMEENIPFLRRLSDEKNEYLDIHSTLMTNKPLKRLLENEGDKAALIAQIQGTLNRLKGETATAAF